MPTVVMNPVHNCDPTGHFSLPNWAKWVIGGVAFAGAVALTALSGGDLNGSKYCVRRTNSRYSKCYSRRKLGFLDGVADGALMEEFLL